MLAVTNARVARSIAQVEMLQGLQRDSFAYFVNEANPANGLVFDKTRLGNC
ncbi:hypothetical protein D8I24_0577 (plasmid) [Cupriavidus necator H850]|uniref:hypothetical protein n=1 Tax=Cupriavidus necator TaxID=106590 RepID=UPI001892B401|nr:hypothetical protein [Cupriavidus necator]KAI3610315.1 hypothetical protein D8I24_0577 [Cupriavidus necator H850]